MKFPNLREMLTDTGPDAGLSYGRIGSLVALLFTLIWVSYLVLKNGALPSLDGATGFVTAPYIASKAAGAVQSFSKGGK